jgi:SAM-dependent methyltransferase
VEVGCGQGATLNYLPSFGATMYGMDMSFQSLQQARSGAMELGYLENIHTFQADAENLPFRNESFELAISVGVLHHTADTARAIQEIYRLLKPGGLAIVMLYRSGNPKWWLTNLLRRYSRFVDFLYKKPNVLAERIRARQKQNSSVGTAFLELYGVPILNAFSNREAQQMFSNFSNVTITNHEPGFRRLADVLSGLKPLELALQKLDQATWNAWGFCQVIEATK